VNKVRYGWLLLPALAVALWVANASRPGIKAEGCPAGCVTAGERREGPLRLLSLNLLHDFPRFKSLGRRLELVSDEIRRQDADIVCLQEVPWVARLGNGAATLARQTGLNYLYLRANGNRWAILFEEGEAILSRYPLQEPAFIELQPPAGLFEHRVALQATAITPWGALPITVAHLTNGDPQINLAQAQSLLAFVERSRGGPAVVAGDFNAKEDSPQIQAMSRQWIDAYRTTSQDPGATCCIDDLTTGPGHPLEKRIDYLFLAPGQGARVVSSRRVLAEPQWSGEEYLWASDHVGLLVEIGLGQPE